VSARNHLFVCTRAPARETPFELEDTSKLLLREPKKRGKPK
jgi:hypothetical protein